jgi:hypothetical protein
MGEAASGEALVGKGKKVGPPAFAKRSSQQIKNPNARNGRRNFGIIVEADESMTAFFR